MRAIDIDYFVNEWAKEHLDVDLYDLEYEYEHFFDELPIIEAEPIKHGRWELREGFNHLVKCSVCGHEYIDYLECDNYCGNCGAKMDEEVER